GGARPGRGGGRARGGGAAGSSRPPRGGGGGCGPPRQAVRRVIPPLLNDFIGLQKDTALVGVLGAIEAFNQSQIDVDATFNFTPYLAAAALFVAVPIPPPRFPAWLIVRARRRRQATGAIA